MEVITANLRAGHQPLSEKVRIDTPLAAFSVNKSLKPNFDRSYAASSARYER